MGRGDPADPREAIIDFAQAYLVACAETTGVNRVTSFDRSIDRVTSIERIEPPEV